MLILRRAGATLLLLIGILLLVYGISGTVKSLMVAIYGSRAYGLGGMLGSLIAATFGYSISAYGLRMWKRN